MSDLMLQRSKNPASGSGWVWALCLILIFSGSASGAEVRYVGAILDGPTAPTSLAIDGQGIGVLEPYERQVEVFTADGVLDSKVNISGDARGLAHVHVLIVEGGHENGEHPAHGL